MAKKHLKRIMVVFVAIVMLAVMVLSAVGAVALVGSAVLLAVTEPKPETFTCDMCHKEVYETINYVPVNSVDRILCKECTDKYLATH